MESGYPKVLTVTSVTYYSQGDERSFFAWLKRTRCVGDLAGVLHDLNVTITRPPTDNELRELIALFYRYKVDMTQLAQFETIGNVGWFRKRGMFWHRRTFRRATSSVRPVNRKRRA